jgi:hypothetical protein
MNDQYKNGLELILLLSLVLETMDDYQVKGKAKETARAFKIQVQKSVEDKIANMYKNDEEFVHNALKITHNRIKQVAAMNLADQILYAEYTDRFVKNIDLIRAKGVVFFDKLI